MPRSKSTLHITRSWRTPGELVSLFLSREIVQSSRGLTLSEHQVITDENGHVVDEFMGYADTAFEEISETTWVRKTFMVENPDIKDPTICIASALNPGNATRLTGTFNGKPFSSQARFNCTPWYNFWTLIPVPSPLRKGANDLVLHTTGRGTWKLFIAPCPHPNRSARSVDAGLTWDDEHLGKAGFIDGEYCIRLSGQRTADHGSVASPPIQVRSDSAAPTGRVRSLAVTAAGASTVEVRLGTGPWTDRAGVWTAWHKLSVPAVKRMEARLKEPGPRFVQFRIHLKSHNGRAPVLRSISLSASLEAAGGASAPAVAVRGPATILPGRSFAHQGASEKLAFLRKKFKLDRVFSAGKDPWDGLLRLVAWAGHFCTNRTNGVHLIPKPIYDAQQMLELGHEKRMAVHCGGLAYVVVQLASAFGITGRVVCRGNHLVTEFWSPVHRKWAVVDPMDNLRNPKTGKMNVWTGGYGAYYCGPDGLPMSAIELGNDRGKIRRRHFIWKTGAYRSRPATVARDLRWFRKEVSYPERNNYTDVAEPFFRGDVFRYSGHLKLRLPGLPEMPWYAKYTARPGDVEWTVGETSVFATTRSDGRVILQFRSQLPNTASYDLGPRGQVEQDTYVWNPTKTGPLSVRAVNTLGQSGPETLCRMV